MALKNSGLKEAVLQAQLVVVLANLWQGMTYLVTFVVCRRPYQEFPQRYKPAFKKIIVLSGMGGHATLIEYRMFSDMYYTVLTESASVGKRGHGMRKAIF